MLAMVAAAHAAGGIGPEALVVVLIVAALLLYAAFPLWSWEQPRR